MVVIEVNLEMGNKDFEIYFKKIGDRRTFRATVQVVSESSNILRLKVKAGTKEMEMEKYLFRKGNQWKTNHFNFRIEGSSKVNEQLMKSIQEAIDKKIGLRGSP